MACSIYISGKGWVRGCKEAETGACYTQEMENPVQGHSSALGTWKTGGEALDQARRMTACSQVIVCFSPVSLLQSR